MADPYTALAAVYAMVGLADASEALRQRLFDKIQSDGWLGRRILDLGCGIGQGACWFGANGFRVTGIDASDAMLVQARQRADEMGVTVDFVLGDMVQTDVGTDYDLVLALNVLNELHGIRALEAAFRAAHRALSTGKLFVFDLTTVQGLAEQWGTADRVLYDAPDELALLVRSQFSYETLVNSRTYTLFQQQDEAWHRADETHTLRGFALQAVGALLQRAGFKVETVLNPAFETFDPYTDTTGQAIFIALKAQD